ncbi:MAG TPA: hypothetical protein ENK19_03135 [Acidobacteria bacterium]|nr:hypothetical protein [Acidobacteriota bacterium]
MASFDLLKPRHRRRDPVVRRAAVKGLTDEEILRELAATDPDLEVRLLAVDRIVSEEALYRVARDGKHLDARLKAARRIRNPRILARLMRERKQPDLMMACFEGIRDHDVLREIASDPGQSVTARRIAINMFADQELLLEMLRSVGDPGLRRAAIERVQDPELRARLTEELEERRSTVRLDRILDSFDAEVVVEVLGAFRDSETAVRALGTLAERGGDAGVRAVEILVRQLRHARGDLRLEALRELARLGAAPGNLLEEMAENDPDPRVRSEAAATLADGNQQT